MSLVQSNEARVGEGSLRLGRGYSTCRLKQFLVAEREASLAVEHCLQLTSLGAIPHACPPTNDAALAYLIWHHIDAAIVSTELQDGPSGPLQNWLECHAIPFIELRDWPCASSQGHGKHCILSKPLDPREFRRALESIAS